MLETEFKALMYLGRYIDDNLLHEGIYISQKPFIYSNDDTIEGLVEQGKRMKDLSGAQIVSDKYLENLKQCELVKILVTTVDE
jgi:hypothetical protein